MACGHTTETAGTSGSVPAAALLVGGDRSRRPLVRGGVAMTVAAQMLDTYPKDLGGIDREKLRTCIDACTECAQACTAACAACGDECEQHASMHEHCRLCECVPPLRTSPPRSHCRPRAA